MVTEEMQMKELLDALFSKNNYYLKIVTAIVGKESWTDS